MSPDLAIRFLSDRRRSLAVWAVGLTAYAAFIVSFFPSIRDSPSFATALEDYPDALKELFGGEAGFDLTSGPGFVGAELYYLALPLLLTIVAIGYGAALGAEQESGLTDLILCNPLTRRRVIVERALTIVVAVTLLAGLVTVAVAVGDAIVDLEIGLSPLLAAATGNVVLAVLHGLVALVAAAVTGKRSLAVGTATAAFALGYLLHVAAGFIDWLESARVLSPYYHATGSSPLATGWPVDNLAILLAVSAVALAAAVMAFDRKDLA